MTTPKPEQPLCGEHNGATVFSRRRFLASSGALVAGMTAMSRPVASAETVPVQQAGTVGLALGSGGASGLAHIPMLEVFDELGVSPHLITGSSIGAIIGASYASGLSGRAIRKMIADISGADVGALEALFVGDSGLSLLDLVQLDIDEGGLLDSQNFLDFLQGRIRHETFEQLPIPLKVVAADFWKREQVVIDSGPLIPALKASMAVPGLFAPTVVNDRLLVDGGTVNPLPYDLLFNACDISVAIDVSGASTAPLEEKPDILDAVFNTFDIMQQAITAEKMKHHQPDVYIRPDISGVRLLHFHKAEEIYAQAVPAAQKLKQALKQRLF